MVRTRLPPVDDGDVVRLAVAALHPSLKQVIDPGYHRPLGTKILHQPQRLFRDESLEARHHFHVGAPEAVDGLFRVPNNEQLARGQGDIGPPVGAVLGGGPRRHIFRQECRDLGLDGVGVLGFIHQDMAVAFPEVVPDFQIVPQEIAGPDQQILKLGLPLPFPFLGVLQDELSHGSQQRHEASRPN